MMQLLTTGGLGREFRSSADAAAYQKIFARQQEEQRLRRERNEDVRNDDAEFMDAAMSVISISESAEFRVELDLYDTATVTALQENEIELAAVRKRMNTLLGRAYVLPDGRRVFKTQDGLRVFDEHGFEIDAAVLDPDVVEDSRPRWEEYKPEFERSKELIAKQTELLEYQTKLDEARERLDSDEMTRQEFDDLREDLKTDMPDAVRAHAPGMEAAADPAAEPLAQELDIADDMVPSQVTTKVFTPVIGG
jgi:hypothetical protein